MKILFFFLSSPIAVVTVFYDKSESSHTEARVCWLTCIDPSVLRVPWNSPDHPTTCTDPILVEVLHELVLFPIDTCWPQTACVENVPSLYLNHGEWEKGERKKSVNNFFAAEKQTNDLSITKQITQMQKTPQQCYEDL